MRGIKSLTGIRGVAALWVVMYHIQYQAARDWHLPWLQGARILERGWAGVDLFFVLSGFVLMLNHGAEFAGQIRAPVRRFAKLRFARVYPLSFAVLLIITTLVAADPGFRAWYQTLEPGNLSAEAFARTAFLATRWFLPGSGDWNQPVWSLSAEILGYAAFPFLAFGLMTCRSCYGALAIGGASLAALAEFQAATQMVGVIDIHQPGAVVRMAFCFLAGVALARARMLAPRNLARHAAALTFGALILTLAAVMTWRVAILMPLGFSLLIFALSFESGRVNAALASGPIVFLGRISFPLYLFHAVALLWLQYHLAALALSPVQTVAILAAYVTICLLVATVLHYAVERPSHRLARAWAGARQSPLGVAQPASP